MQTGLWPGKKMDGKRAFGLATWLSNHCPPACSGLGLPSQRPACNPNPKVKEAPPKRQ